MKWGDYSAGQEVVVGVKGVAADSRSGEVYHFIRFLDMCRNARKHAQFLYKGLLIATTG